MTLTAGTQYRITYNTSGGMSPPNLNVTRGTCGAPTFVASIINGGSHTFTAPSTQNYYFQTTPDLFGNYSYYISVSAI